MTIYIVLRDIYAKIFRRRTYTSYSVANPCVDDWQAMAWLAP